MMRRLARRPHIRNERSVNMQDLIFVAATIAFFVIAVGYAQFCDRVK